MIAAALQGDVTGLIVQATSGTVPKGTRSVLVQLSLLGSGGSYNHGFADNLSLVLTTLAGGHKRSHPGPQPYNC